MSRGPYPRVAARNRDLLAAIRAAKADHPFWGYRRIWAYLRFVLDLAVNKKRVYRLMREHGLVVAPNARLRAARTPPKPKPRPTRPNQWWGIDMTKVMTASGWVYVVVVLDWRTKKVVGHYAGGQARAAHWLAALDMAVNRQFPQGVRGRELNLMSDNGCQPTSERFMRACRTLEIRQAFTSYNNPKGNADTERFMRTLKEELVWINEWSGETQLRAALDRWIEEYNTSYLHSALGYTSPAAFERKQLGPDLPFQWAC
jgi:transposase InsO family protein